MKKFTGSLEDLKRLVAETGFEGTWREIQHGHQFDEVGEGAVLCWYSKRGKIVYRGDNARKAELQHLLGSSAEDSAASAPESFETPEIVFVVHGHDDVAREQLELALHRLGLEPFVLANTGGDGLTIIEALEKQIGRDPDCKFGIVLLTPDDYGYAKRDGESSKAPRARQNVVLEMGMLISSLRRERVAILKKGHIETPSDAAGIIYIPFNDHVREAVPKLVDRLRNVGFTIDVEAVTRASS